MKSSLTSELRACFLAHGYGFGSKTQYYGAHIFLQKKAARLHRADKEQ
jgi:hypothetical protein